MQHLALHLLHRHLGRWPVHVLDKSTASAWRDLGVHNVTVSPKEASQVFLCYAAAQGSDEQGCIVGVKLTDYSCTLRSRFSTATEGRLVAKAKGTWDQSIFALQAQFCEATNIVGTFPSAVKTHTASVSSEERQPL